MANTGVTGQIVFSPIPTQRPLLIAQAVDVDAVPGKDSLGWGPIDATGMVKIQYPAITCWGREWKPNIVIRIFDLYGRLIHETREYPDVTVVTLDIGTITLHPKAAQGVLVTNALLNPISGDPVRLTSGNAIEFLIDNEKAWNAITDAVASAKISVNFMILYFEVPGVISKFPDPMPTEGTKIVGESIQEKMKGKASLPGAEAVSVSILANDFSPDIFGNLDTASEVTKFFLGSMVTTRLYQTDPRSPMHAKLLIADAATDQATAYLISSPVMQEYWDSDEHKIDDPRRGSMGLGNAIKVPIHDVSVKVMGPTVGDIHATFIDAWNKADTTSTPSSPWTGQLARTGNNVATVQILRTLPGNFPGAPHGETGVLEAYQRAIAQAEEFIYIEDQYFTSLEIVEAIIHRLDLNKDLEVILLLNIKVDIPGYSRIQPRVISALQIGVERIGAKDRLGMFSLWSHEERTPKTGIIRNYVHSKTAIIDDKWATVGSANTDGTSMSQTQTFDVSWNRLQKGRSTQHANPNLAEQPYRSIELNLAIYNGVDGQPTTPIIGDLRRRLWAEHLGYPSDQAENLKSYSGGWLQLWKDKAQEKEQGLKLATPVVRKPRVLRWVTESDSSKYLTELGIDIEKLDVRTEVRSFDFESGHWK